MANGWWMFFLKRNYFRFKKTHFFVGSIFVTEKNEWKMPFFTCMYVWHLCQLKFGRIKTNERKRKMYPNGCTQISCMMMMAKNSKTKISNFVIEHPAFPNSLFVHFFSFKSKLKKTTIFHNEKSIGIISGWWIIPLEKL